ncbi:alpha/beta-hydrolase [Thermothelomyces heterothallicus CBS 203.75]
MSINWDGIKAAKRLELESSEPSGFKTLRLRFEVPLSHSDPAGSVAITIHADLVYGAGPDANDGNGIGHFGHSTAETILESILCPSRASLCLYLCGGPGDGNPASKNPDLTRELLSRFGPVLYVDYRGTGKSSAITKDTLATKTAEEAAWYLSQFRQDSIAADLEGIRKSLGGRVRFVLVAQSFGGWIAMTYLSYLPESLAEVWLFGGMPPMGNTPEQVYRALYRRLVRINQEYYSRYPEDKARVMRIVERLSSTDDGRGLLISEETGERLSCRGFLTMGRHFGGEDGFKTVHSLVERFSKDADAGGFSSGTIRSFRGRNGTGFKLPQRPLYGAVHEAIYCFGPGVASNWAAQRVGRDQAGGNFAWLGRNFRFEFPFPDQVEPLSFSAEMIFDFMLHDAGSELGPFVKAAEILARKEDWPALYDLDALGRNTVPVRALMYPADLYVDFELSTIAAAGVSNCRAIPAPERWLHGSVKTNPKEVFEFLATMA